MLTFTQFIESKTTVLSTVAPQLYPERCKTLLEYADGAGYIGINPDGTYELTICNQSFDYAACPFGSHDVLHLLELELYVWYVAENMPTAERSDAAAVPAGTTAPVKPAAAPVKLACAAAGHDRCSCFDGKCDFCVKGICDYCKGDHE